MYIFLHIYPPFVRCRKRNRLSKNRINALLITLTSIGASIIIEINPNIIWMEKPSINTLNCGATLDNIPSVIYMIMLIPTIGRAILMAIINISIKVLMDKSNIFFINLVFSPPSGMEE